MVKVLWCGIPHAAAEPLSEVLTPKTKSFAGASDFWVDVVVVVDVVVAWLLVVPGFVASGDALAQEANGMINSKRAIVTDTYDLTLPI